MNIPQPWILSVDRTEWKFGKTTFNILMLGIVYQGIAFPVVWSLLDKRGNSNTCERMQLFQRFLEYFPDKAIDHLSADREFVGQDWFCYLLADPNTPFRIRIKDNYKLGDGKRHLKVKTVFQDLKPGQTKVLRRRRRVWGLELYIAALRLEDGSLVVVATQTVPHRALAQLTEGLADYAHRWGIETLFGIFKTRGFCLESTHLQDSERLSKLIAILTLALCWAVLVGEWLHQNQPIKIKKHGRRSKSIFRYGLDFLRSILLNLGSKMGNFIYVLQFLSCT